MRPAAVATGQRARAEAFTRLHHGKETLALANAWDAASARVFELAGAKAIGTSSAGLAFSRGYADGERIPRDEMIAAVRRIVDSVSVPVTVDIEAGYGTTMDEILETVRAVIEAGGVGVNLEDAPLDRPGELREVAEQAALVSAIRELAERSRIDLYLNARTDVFWLGLGEPETRLATAVGRAVIYRDAGASGVFVPGVTDAETIAALVAGVGCPLNVLAGPTAPDLATLGRLGVARLSVGSAPMRAVLALTRRMGHDLLQAGRYDSLYAETIPYAEANRLFLRERDGEAES